MSQLINRYMQIHYTFFLPLYMFEIFCNKNYVYQSSHLAKGKKKDIRYSQGNRVQKVKQVVTVWDEKEND